MQQAKDYFNDLTFLEQKCPGCENVLDFGENTEFHDEKGCQVCMNCGHDL